MIFALVSFFMPCAFAEVSRDLDPMMPADPQATVTDASSVNGVVSNETSNVVSTADATAGVEKKAEKTKIEKKAKKSKKNSTAKSSKKDKKSSSHKKSGSDKSKTEEKSSDQAVL